VIRQVSVWPAFIMAGRVYVEHLQGRHLKPNRLVQEVSPEFVSRATATRYIADWAQDGLYDLRQSGRSYQIHPTPKFIAFLEDVLAQRLQTLNDEGILGRATRASYRIIRGLDGRLVDAENVESTLGYSREWLLAEEQDILNTAPPGQRESDPATADLAAMDRGVRLQHIRDLARAAGWVQFPWSHRDAGGRMRPIVVTIKSETLDGVEVLNATCDMTEPQKGNERSPVRSI
jgi:hypothetical protein